MRSRTTFLVTMVMLAGAIIMTLGLTGLYDLPHQTTHENWFTALVGLFIVAIAQDFYQQQKIKELKDHE